VGIFPNAASLERLTTAILMEMDEDWQSAALLAGGLKAFLVRSEFTETTLHNPCTTGRFRRLPTPAGWSQSTTPCHRFCDAQNEAKGMLDLLFVAAVEMDQKIGLILQVIVLRQLLKRGQLF
jgi:hypothetical protein